MPGRVPWERLSGEEVEAMIASFISMRHPEAIRIRPSRGDKGIDVKRKLEDGSFVVYQVKSFASNLSSSQKRQIERSWERLKAFLLKEGLTLSEWHLVMPLDPTTENEKWLEKVTADFKGKVFWRGLSHVDVWAADMPKIADYFVMGGRDAVLAEIRQALDAARFPDLTKRDELTKHISVLQEMLSDVDPFYDYRLRVLDRELDDIDTIKSKPGLVMTTMEFVNDDDRVIAIDVYAKSNLSHEVAPIKEKVTFIASTDEQKAQLQSFIDFGTPLMNFPCRYEEAPLPLLSEGSDQIEESYVTVSPLENTHSLKAALRNAAGIQLPISQTSFSYGKRGFQWEGKSQLGFLRLRINGIKQSGKMRMQLGWSHEVFVHAPVGKVRKELSFIKSGENIPFDILLGEVKIGSLSFKGSDFSFDLANNELALAKSLEAIDAISDGDIAFPDIRKMASSVANMIFRVDSLSKGDAVVAEWERFKIDRIHDESLIVEDPVRILHVLPLRIEIEDTTHDLGMLVQTEYTGRIKKEGSEYYCCPTEEYGCHAVQKAIERTPENYKLANQLFTAECISVEEWEEYVDACGSAGIQKQKGDQTALNPTQ